MGDDSSWRTPSFRQSVVSKIDEAIRQSGMNTSRNSIEMENHVFQKAKNREEYLGFVARLILHVREMNTKKGAGMGGPGAGQAGPGMPDPINALQNLASQGSRNNQMMGMGGPPPNAMGGAPQINASNLLQTLNRGPGGQPMSNPQGGMPPRPQMQMGPNGGPLASQMGQMAGQIPNAMAQQQMGGQMPGNMAQMAGQMPMQGQMQGPVPSQMASQIQMAGQMQMGGPMQCGPMGNQMPNQMPAQMLNSMQQIQQNKPGGNIMMNVPNNGFPRNPTPNQFVRLSPSASVQSPVSLPCPPSGGQMIASPALAPSPGAPLSMMGGPGSSGGAGGGGGPPRSLSMAPSPSSTSLNTPGPPGQSPMGMQEEHAYKEKVRQLSKFIEPLRNLTARMSSDGEQIQKMKKLLELLTNPTQSVSLETLLKCEVVLEKMDFKRSDGSVPPSSHLKEHHPLLEAVSNCLQNPTANHTLHRTFGPTLDALFGPEIKLVPPLKRQKLEEPTSDIPDVLQGEIARLDQRFKVSLDQNQQVGSKSIQLNCWLDDKHLPCVPPVSLSVPEDYPKTAPTCDMAAYEYNATKFLSDVQTALLARIKRLPKHFSVSQLLDTWEMSVRQASSPNNTSTSQNTTLLGA